MGGRAKSKDMTIPPEPVARDISRKVNWALETFLRARLIEVDAKQLSRNGRLSARAKTQSTLSPRPFDCNLQRAVFSIERVRSTPTTDPSRETILAKSAAKSPVPVATSSIRSWLRGLAWLTTYARHRLSCPKESRLNRISYSNGTFENRVRTYRALASNTG